MMHLAWSRLSVDLVKLAADANAVIALRLARIAMGGPDVGPECQRMVAEKVSALVEAQTRAVFAVSTGRGGEVPRLAVAHYRRKVAANRRRLARG